MTARNCYPKSFEGEIISNSKQSILTDFSILLDCVQDFSCFPEFNHCRACLQRDTSPDTENNFLF